VTPDLLANHSLAHELARCGNLFHRWQWSLASSSNYSALLDSETVIISRSGVDKERMSSADFMLVDLYGRPKPEFTAFKPSAETELHCHVYRIAKERHFTIGSVLHTHAKYAVYFSRRYRKQGSIAFSGFEIQKIFEGINTHDCTVVVPVLANSQNMADIVAEFNQWLQVNPWPPGYLIEGHGIYAWGKTVLHARQKLEALEHLMELKYMEENNAKPIDDFSRK
jgi:methylthioribulose-1-phosphate dehydratase